MIPTTKNNKNDIMIYAIGIIAKYAKISLWVFLNKDAKIINNTKDPMIFNNPFF